VTPSRVTGIVLAGGASRRFGRDKLREELRGEPLLAHAVRRLAEVVPEICVVTTRDDRLPSLPADLTVEYVRDLIEHEGPLRGTARGLRSVDSDWSIVVGGDMPDLQPSVLTALVGFAAARDASGAALGEGDHFRPLPCVVRTAAALEVAERLLAQGERSLRSLLAQLSVAVLEEGSWLPLDPERRTLRDVDRPSDLAEG